MGNINCCIRSLRGVSGSKASLTIPSLLMLATNVVQADEFIPQLKAHGKPSPFQVMPLYSLIYSGGETPYVQPQADPTQGAIDTVVNSSSRTALFGTSYRSATHGHETFADVRKKGSQFYGRAIVVDESASEYEGQSNQTIRFGYNRKAGQLVIGTTPTSNTDIKLVYIRDRIEENKNPVAAGVAYNQGTLKVAEGFGVDPMDTDRQVAKLIWDEQLNGDVVQDIHLELSSINLDRAADNFSLRDTASALQQKVKVDRTVNGFKADSNLMMIGAQWNIALDYSDINHDAKRYGGPKTAGLNIVSAYHYPGVEMDEWLLSAVSKFDITEKQAVTFGVDYKYVRTKATKATNNKLGFSRYIN